MHPANGGTTTAVRDLVEGCIKSGVPSTVLSLDSPTSPWLESSSTPIQACGPGLTHYGWNPHFQNCIARQLDQDPRLIVHGLWQHHAVAARRACLKSSVPYVVYPHGMLDPWALGHSGPKKFVKWINWQLLMRPVLRDCSQICFTTPAELDAAAPMLANIKSPKSIVPLGVRGAPGSLQGLRHQWQQRHPALRNRRIVLFLGRLHHKKGCEILIGGFSKWLKSSPPSSTGFHLRMAGPASSPTYAEHLRILARESGLQEGVDISFPGMVEGNAKWQELAAASAFILPSYQENFGLTVGEALSAQIPTLLSSKVNTAQWVAAAGAGIVADPTLNGVVELLSQWNALDTTQLALMSQKAGTLYHARFAPERAIAAFLCSVRNL